MSSVPESLILRRPVSPLEPLHDLLIHPVSFTSLPRTGVNRAAKSPTRLASSVISGQAAVIFSSRTVCFGAGGPGR